MKNTASGNILWFILLAVVLLGMLTLVLTGSGSSVNQTGSVENRTISNSQLLRYAKGLQAAVEQLQLRSCSENTISFENATVAGYENTNNPSDESCFIFSDQGTGATWKEVTNTDISITPGTNSGIVTGYSITGVGNGTGAAGVDLLYLAGVTSEQCTALNADFGITGSVATTIAAWATPFVGTFTATTTLGAGGQANGIAGKQSGCITMNDGTPVFYQVLLAR